MSNRPHDAAPLRAPACPPLPPVIGHRGAAATAPENTLAGLAEARRQGARWVEVDIRLSADGLPFLLHDEDLERTTTARGRASALTGRQLLELDAGSRFASSFAGERLPALVAALDLVQRLGLGIVLEIKPDRGREDALLDAVGAALAGRDALPCMVSSSDPALVARAGRRLPHLPRALVADAPPVPGYGLLADLGCCSLHAWERWLVGAELERALASGVLAAYTVNDPARAAALWSAGVTAVFSDVPGRLLGRP